MKNTKVKIINSQAELNEFLSEHDILNVQALTRSHIRESVMRGGGMIEEQNLYWSVWYIEERVEMEYEVGDRFKHNIDNTIIKITKIYPNKLVDVYTENYNMYEGLDIDHINEYYLKINE